MVLDLIELAFACLAGGAMSGATAVVVARRARTRPAEPERCAGYGDKDEGCNALRSPMCTDGRCSFHCRKQCACDKAEEARRG